MVRSKILFTSLKRAAPDYHAPGGKLTFRVCVYGHDCVISETQRGHRTLWKVAWMELLPILIALYSY